MTIFVGYGLFMAILIVVFRQIERRTVYVPMTFKDKVYADYHPGIHARRELSK